MTEENAEDHTSKSLLVLSVIGSVASIIALLIVLLQIAAARINVSEQFMVWRFFLALAALVGCGGVATLAFTHTKETIGTNSHHRAKVTKVSIVIAAAFLMEAVFLDGFFAALYWSPWMSPIWKPVLNVLTVREAEIPNYSVQLPQPSRFEEESGVSETKISNPAAHRVLRDKAAQRQDRKR